MVYFKQIWGLFQFCGLLKKFAGDFKIINLKMYGKKKVISPSMWLYMIFNSSCSLEYSKLKIECRNYCNKLVRNHHYIHWISTTPIITTKMPITMFQNSVFSHWNRAASLLDDRLTWQLWRANMQKMKQTWNPPKVNPQIEIMAI